jgi:hypothetical protein
VKKKPAINWDADEAMLRQLADPVQREAMLKAHHGERERAEALEHAASMRQGRPRVEPPVQHVYDLVAKHPELARKPTKLRKQHADETQLKSMSEGRFRALAAEARKLFGLP